MGRERQKKKNRSSIQKVKPKLRGRTKAGKKKVDFLGSKTVAENWDRKLTLSQNYRRLGLSSRLNAASGGIEKLHRDEHDNEDEIDANSLSLPKPKPLGKILPGTARVVRDPDTGRILKVVRDEEDDQNALNPLHDPLNDIERRNTPKNGVISEQNHVVAALEAQADQEAENIAKRKRPRQQSKRELEWIGALVEKYGDNIAAMVRDQKLNPMQQTEGDIKRRVQQYRNRDPISAA